MGARNSSTLQDCLVRSVHAVKPGRVVKIRVRPQHCIAVVDIVDKLGVFRLGMSFAEVVSLALAALCESARAAKALPDRDGSEYTQVMSRFPQEPSALKALQGRKLEITREMNPLHNNTDLRLAELSKKLGTQELSPREAMEFESLKSNLRGSE